MFEKLPQWMQEEVAKSDTWQVLLNVGFEEPDGEEETPF